MCWKPLNCPVTVNTESTMTPAVIKSWPPESLPDRLTRCAAMLRIHGIINDSQRYAMHLKLLAKFPQPTPTKPKKKAKK